MCSREPATHYRWGMATTPTGKELERHVNAFLAERATMALATRDEHGVWVASVYFAGDARRLFFLSSPSSRHGRNLDADPRVAVAINADEHDWQAIRGVQLDGRCEAVVDRRELLAAWRCYVARFRFVPALLRRAREQPGSLGGLLRARMYVVRPDHVYYLDNSLGFGERREVPIHA